MMKLLLPLLSIILFLSSCGHSEKEETANGADTLSLEAPVFEKASEKFNDTNYQGLPQVGQASYYAKRFHGRPTANGEVYDSARYTAAHKTLPFGTKLKVTNLQNDKSVVVTVNDRGPHHKNRIIDLSKAAARELGFLNRGTTKVKIEEAK